MGRQEVPDQPEKCFPGACGRRGQDVAAQTRTRLPDEVYRSRVALLLLRSNEVVLCTADRNLVGGDDVGMYSDRVTDSDSLVEAAGAGCRPVGLDHGQPFGPDRGYLPLVCLDDIGTDTSAR